MSTDKCRSLPCKGFGQTDDKRPQKFWLAPGLRGVRLSDSSVSSHTLDTTVLMSLMMMIQLSCLAMEINDPSENDFAMDDDESIDQPAETGQEIDDGEKRK